VDGRDADVAVADDVADIVDFDDQASAPRRPSMQEAVARARAGV